MVYNNLQTIRKYEVIRLPKYKTRQREILLEYLKQHADEQISVKQIVQSVDTQEISASAVYRNIAMLEREGVLKRCVRGNTKEICYRYTATDSCRNSLHLSCRICGKSIHMPSTVAEKLTGITLEKMGFEVDKGNTVIYGICKECRK